MPVIYAPSSQPQPHSQHRQQPLPTDADDSIVLSDLVRQGEVSRLRRRGAMRLEHGPMGAQQTTPTQVFTASSAPPFIPPSSDSESEADPDDGPVFARNTSGDREQRSRSAYGYSTARTRSRGEPPEDSDDMAYALFCGNDHLDGEMDVDGHAAHWSKTPFQPSILPLYPSTEYTHASSSTKRPPTKKSNGCGALLHMNAAPRRRLGVFTAKNEASTGAVIAMDADYFDRAAVAKIVRSACGCIREGIGCAVCGKPLGTRYKPCKTASEGIFTSRANSRSHTALHPEGSPYWHAQSHTRSHSSSATPSTTAHHDQSSSISSSNYPSPPFYVYTFFSTSVSSSPPYHFPPRQPPIVHAPPPEPQQQPQPQPQRSPFQLLPQQPQPMTITSQYRPRLLSQIIQRPQSAQPSRQVPSPFPRPRSTADPVLRLNDDESDNDENVNTASVPQINIASESQPEREPTPPPLIADNATPSSTLNLAMFDRGLTASPTSISDLGDSVPTPVNPSDQVGSREEVYTQYEYQEGDGYRERTYRYGIFDPDGEFVAEPDSPDKTGEVIMLPDR